MPEERDPYKIAQEQLQNALDVLDYPNREEVWQSLKEPERILEVSIPTRMDNGEIKDFKGFRCQHNTALGPAKGGVRYHWNVSRSEVKSLAMWMTWKNSLAHIPYGGGKGGIICNPKEMSKKEKERLSRNFFRAIAPVVGVNKDVPAPDVYTDPQTMAWFFDEYSKLKGYPEYGVVTAKPPLIGGSQGRTEATGFGTAVAAREACKAEGIDINEATVSVQGYGNVAWWAAKFLHDWGAKIVSASDSKGAIYVEDGFDPIALHEWKEEKSERHTVTDWEGKIDKKFDPKERAPLFLDADVVIPAALENQITEKNADKVKGKIIVEGANGPVTPAADKILYEKGILDVPDIQANAGGVICSYFEWVQNRTRYYWKKERVMDELEKKIKRSFKETYKRHKEEDIDMRTAAYTLAIDRVVKAMKLRGKL